MPTPISQRKTHYEALVAYLLQPDVVREMGAYSPQLPEALAQWLGQLILLQGVPFHYLVPDERMLPIESIRFFQVDVNWLAALIDGANSIGRVVEADITFDQAFFADIVFEEARLAAGIDSDRLSGFLLRSQLVSDYWTDAQSGIRVDGYANRLPDDPDVNFVPDPLQILRLERLAPNVMLCLFDGVCQEVRLHQPAEGLHFGLDRTDDGFAKQLKIVKAADPALDDVGNYLPQDNPHARLIVQSDTAGTTYMRRGADRVLKVSRVFADMRQQLTQAGALTASDLYTAAEFALEMVEGVDMVRFVAPGGSQ